MSQQMGYTPIESDCQLWEIWRVEYGHVNLSCAHQSKLQRSQNFISLKLNCISTLTFVSKTI